MKPECSIVIRAYNEENHIGRLLDGIAQQSIRNAQVILVDSGSTDHTVQIAQGYQVDIVHIKPHDFTFGRSLNLGIQKANADLIVIASAHVYPVYPDWLKKIIEPFQDKQVALTYGKQRGCETSHFSENQIFHNWYPEQTQLHQRNPFCNNANAAIRKSLWKKQPYNENLPALEDLAWARWVLDKGYKIAYVAEAEIIHVHNESYRGIYNRYKREAMAFKQIYPQENFQFIDVFRLFFANAGSDIREAARQKKLHTQFHKILSFRWNQFWGTYQGYCKSGPLTWQLKQSFYYPRASDVQSKVNNQRDVEPISYEKLSELKKHQQ